MHPVRDLLSERSSLARWRANDKKARSTFIENPLRRLPASLLTSWSSSFCPRKLVSCAEILLFPKVRTPNEWVVPRSSFEIWSLGASSSQAIQCPPASICCQPSSEDENPSSILNFDGIKSRTSAIAMPSLGQRGQNNLQKPATTLAALVPEITVMPQTLASEYHARGIKEQATRAQAGYVSGSHCSPN